MKPVILGLLAETPIHCGAGRSMGVIDLPVARESTTDYPVISGSGMKGALLDKARKSASEEQLNTWFGYGDSAGALMISDARLLLLPVRSLNGPYKWITCPYVIERLKRDMLRAGLKADFDIPGVPQDEEGSTAYGKGTDSIFLEEREFSISKPIDSQIMSLIKGFIMHDDVKNRLEDQLLILSDKDFAWFTRYGLTVQARNVLEEGTKMSKNLWYQESLPVDTLMYLLLIPRQNGDTAGESVEGALDKIFPEDDRYLQTGGNETTGQGWLVVNIVESGS